ncbi:MAG: M15 family metallopeptidase [Actinomycetota bacterium]
MSIRSLSARLGAGLAGLVLGATLMLAVQGSAVVPGRTGRPIEPVKRLEKPPLETMLAWTPGMMPPGFAAKARRLDAVDHAVVVSSGTAWLTASHSASGSLVDNPRGGYAIPLEVAGVATDPYRPFLPPGARRVLLDLDEGRVVLGETSAELRNLGTGATLSFGKRRVKVAGVLSDELLGAHELLASRRTAAKLTARGGELRPRYALVAPRPGARAGRVRTRLGTILPPGTPMQVRLPGTTPFFRQGDAVLPPVTLKSLFGEFAARRAAGGFLRMSPGWEHANIKRDTVPIIGRVLCNRAILSQLEGAMREIKRSGLAHLVDPGDYGGCYSPRFINRVPGLGISHHAWGIALDVNVSRNPFGTQPDQDRRIVDVFSKWGFTWGGAWLVPDGMHFEYIRPPENLSGKA